MIQRAMLLSAAFDQMMSDGTEHMRLTSTDWKFLRVALLILEPLEPLTKRNAAYRCATINMATLSYVNPRKGLSSTQDILGRKVTICVHYGDLKHLIVISHRKLHNPQIEGFKVGVTNAVANLDQVL
jgi:hypothetical protein